MRKTHYIMLYYAILSYIIIYYSIFWTSEFSENPFPLGSYIGSELLVPGKVSFLKIQVHERVRHKSW